MNITLSHYSALAFWVYASLPDARRRDFSAILAHVPTSRGHNESILFQRDFHSPLLKSLLEKERRNLPSDLKLSINSEERKALRSLLGIPFPLQVIGRRNDKRRSGLNTEVHSGASYSTSRQIISVVPGLSVCSPELVFTQLSTMLNITKLAYLGFEMCGTYTVTPHENNMLQARIPLCSVKSIRDAAAKTTRIGNQAKIMEALKVIRDGAASPPESQLIMFLTTTCSKGGGGFKAPQPNGIVLSSKRDRKVSGKLWRACDLYWAEERTAIEYDSEAHHATTSQRCNDAIRRNALVSAGIKVLSVTPGQLHDYKEMLRVEDALAKALGKRPRTQVGGYAEKHKALHKEITRSCPQWRNALFKLENDPHGLVEGSNDEQSLLSDYSERVYGRTAENA